LALYMASILAAVVACALAGEIEAHLEPNDFSGRTVAEQLLWGGASSRCEEIVRLALEHIDWPADDARWFWMLLRPLPGHDDLTPQEQIEDRSRAAVRHAVDDLAQPALVDHAHRPGAGAVIEIGAVPHTPSARCSPADSSAPAA
jgi:hypothetical protein